MSTPSIFTIIVAVLLTGYLTSNQCKETVEVLQQTIKVKEITNRTLKEMIRKKDSIIFVQDSTIVKLQSER